MKLNYGLRSSDKVIRKGFHSHFFRLNKKVLPIALVIMMAIQMVIPFYVLAQVNNNEPNKQVFVEGESYVVNSWEELKELIENGRYKDKQNNWVYIADPYNLNIIINGPIAAKSTITIDSGKTINLKGQNGAIIYGAADPDGDSYSITKYLYSSMFVVDRGTLNTDASVIFSGKRAVYKDDTCEDNVPLNDQSVVGYTSKDKYVFSNYGEISYTKSVAKEEYNYSNSSISYVPYEYPNAYDFTNFTTTYTKGTQANQYSQFSYPNTSTFAPFGIKKAERESASDTTAVCYDYDNNKWRMYFARNPQRPVAVTYSTSGVSDWIRVGFGTDDNGRDYCYFYATEFNKRIYIAADGSLPRDWGSVFDNGKDGKKEYRWYVNEAAQRLEATIDVYNTSTGNYDPVTHYIHRDADTGELSFPTVESYNSSSNLLVNSDKQIKNQVQYGDISTSGSWGYPYHVYPAINDAGTMRRGPEVSSLEVGGKYYIQANNNLPNPADIVYWSLSADHTGNNLTTNGGIVPSGNNDPHNSIWEYMSDGTFRCTWPGWWSADQRLTMYWDGNQIKTTSWANWQSLKQGTNPSLKLKNVEVFKPANSIRGLALSGTPIIVLNSETLEEKSSLSNNDVVVLQSDGLYFFNKDGDWVDEPDDETNFKWTYNDGVLSNGNYKIFIEADGTDPKVVDDSDKGSDPTSDSHLKANNKANNTELELFKGSTTGTVLNTTDTTGTNYITLYESNNSSAPTTEASATLTNGAKYLIKSGDGDNEAYLRGKGTGYEPEWVLKSRITNWPRFDWTYNSSDGTLSHGNYKILVNSDGSVEIVDSTKNKVDAVNPVLKINGTQVYKGNVLTTTSGDPVYLYTIVRNNNNKYEPGDEASSINDSPFYVKAGEQWLKKDNNQDATWAVHPGSGVEGRNYNDSNNPYVWEYDSTKKTLTHGDYVIYLDGTNGIVVNKNEKVGDITFGSNVHYANTSSTTDLFTETGTNSVYMYEVNNDGSKGNHADSGLVLDKYYYLVTEEDNKYLQANDNGGSWTDFTNQTAQNNPFAWKYVEVTRGENKYKVLYNELTDQYIYNDGTKMNIAPNTIIHCATILAERWTPVAKPADFPADANHHHTDAQLPGVNSETLGYFITAKNKANVNVDGTTFKDLYVGKGGAVKNYAPIAINGSSFTMTGGSIEGNWVGYTADDTYSGKQVTGTNDDGSSTKDYLKSKDPTKTAGGIIFTNGATGIITGASSIKNNRGDAGGIIVNGLDTDVTLGGEVVYKEITSIPEDKSYFVKGNDEKYYLVDTDDPSYSDKIPSGVTTDGKMYDASIDSDVGGGHIDNNVGFHYAGAALVENGATLRMVGSDSTMNNNVTWNKGGAVWVTEFGTGGDGKGVSKDFANKKINYDSNGVPINKQPYGEGTFIMTDGYIDNNTAFVRGGGINVESNRVFLIKGNISNNNCRALGGGIYVEGDYADYTYTLVLNRGYVGNNYSVRFWDLNNSEYPNVGGYWDRLNIEQLNDRLDRRISATTNETTITNSNISQNNDSTRTANTYATSPLDDTNIAKGTGYSNRTADAIDFYRPHQGRGGGIWLCPIGGTAIFHMNADNEVIIDDNYASGSSTADKRKGTDIYLESGTGHLLVQNDVTSGQTLENWENEETSVAIEEDSPVLSGPLYLINNTNGNNTYTDSYGVTTTYNQRKAAGQHRGIHIVDNISRDGGGIAGDGTMLFGIPNDLYRHEGRLDFTKIWPEENQNTQAVRFKMFYDYVDDQGNLVETVELPSYAFGLDGSNNTADDYTANPEQPGTNTSNTITWKANVTIPTVVERPDGSSYPMYKLKYNGTKQIKHSFTTSATEKEIIVNKDDILDPSTVEGNKKLYAIATVDPSIELEIVDWRIVVKEYDEYGKEIDTAEFKKIVGRTVTISNDNSIPIDVIDAGGVGKKIKGYNVNYSTVTFGAEVENSKGPKIEKYINNKVHRDLESYDQIFEYEIFAYVPENAEEIVIYDTLEEPLMFVSNNNTPQYVNNSTSVNSAFNTEFTDTTTTKFFMIKNDSVNQMTIHENNNRYSDGTGTVVTDNGVAFTVPVATQAGGKNNPMTAGNVKIGNITPSDKDNNGNVKSITESVSGDTLFIKIDKDSGIEAVQGKWVRIKFYAAIKPEYRNLNALKNDAGWLETTDSKVGSPIDYPRSIRFSGSGWNYLDGIESFVGKQFIKSAIASSSPNAIYRFAKDEYGNYYGQTISTGKWQLLDKNTTPTRAIAKLRFGETYDVATDGQGDNHGTNQFTTLDLSTDLLGYIHHDDFLVDTNEVTSLNGKHVKRGAYGNGKWMFIEDEFGDYYYATKSDYLDFDNIDKKYQLKSGITQANIRWLPVTSAGDDINSPRKESVTQRLNGVYATKMDITSVNYNWPLVDTNKSQVPHYGEANQASYVVNGKNTYNSNIVTVDVFQPEKYVENKVHHLLNKGNQTGAEGAFDEPFEYSIIVKVPDDAQEIVIYDTLRPDLMFVDAAGNTQYETFTIGVSNGNNSTNTSDVTNSAFHKDDNSEYLANAMVVNTNQKYQLANLGETNNHIGNGDPNATVRQMGTKINNYTAIVGTLQNTNTTGATKLGENLYIVETKDSNDNLNGKTLAVKIDNQDTINELKGKFVKLTFKAEIKPSAYDEVVKKLEKKTQYTRDITKAKDYDETTQTATSVGYLRKSSTYTYKKEEAIGYASGLVPQANTKYIEFELTNGGPVEGSALTTDITQALDYNYVTREATPYAYAYAVKDNSGEFSILSDTIPTDGVYNVDYTYLYVKKVPLDTDLSDLEIYLKDYDTFYAGEVPSSVTDYVLVYENKQWDETETWATNGEANNTGKPNWEKVTDNGHIINPADTDENGVHAGLANDATYIIRNDSGYLTSKTNTVTVETKLRDLLFFKKWVVKDTFKMPTMEEFKNHIHLMWEKANEEGVQSSEKKVGEITDLYRDKIKVAYNEAATGDTEGTRYYWTITVTDLPVLRGSLKYFLVEDNDIDGLSAPEYRNDDPTYGDSTTEHAHHYGTIVNIQQDEPGYTHVSVLKNWDVGTLESDEMAEIKQQKVQVQLMIRDSRTGTLVHAYKRNPDNHNAVITPKVAIETTLTGTGNSPWSYTFTDLPEYELDDSGNIRPKMDSDGFEYYYDSYGHGNELGFKIDTDGFPMLKKPDGTTTKEEFGPVGLNVKPIEGTGEWIVANKPVPVLAKYEVEVRSDPEGFILSKETKVKKQYQISDGKLLLDLEGNSEENIPPNISQEKLQEYGYYWKPDKTENGIFSGTYTKVEYTGENWEAFWEDFKGACEISVLPATGGSGYDVTRCYVEAPEVREYETSEVEIINTKPQIEKYVNKDVHDEIYFINDINYDILVYVPEEATEIVIEDKVLDTLKLKSFMKPVQDNSNIIVGYEELPLTTTTIPLAVHVRNDHKIYGTVNSKNAAGYINGNVSVDGNSFKITISNIVHWAAEYIEDEYGDYIKTSNGYVKIKEKGDYIDDSYTDENLQSKLLAQEIYRQDNLFYKKLDITYSYREDAEGLYGLGSDNNYHLITDFPIMIDSTKKYLYDAKTGTFVENLNGTHYQGSDGNYYMTTDTINKADKKAYTIIVNSDGTYNAVGGRYVQVSFKATLNHDKDEELKEFIERISSMKPNSDFDWDVIKQSVNDGWDAYIKQTLTNNSLPQDSKYVPASTNTIEESEIYMIQKLKNYLAGKDLTLSKAIKFKFNDLSNRLEAKDSAGNVYITYLNPKRHPWTEGKWFRAYESGNATLFEDISTGDSYSHGDVQEVSGDQSAAGHINGQVDNNNNSDLLSGNYIPVEPEEYVKIGKKYYLREEAKKYLPENSGYDDATATIYHKIDWGLGDGHVIREYPDAFTESKYVGDHTGITNTARYDITYGNGIKSSHKSNTVTVVPHIYELPSSGGMGTFLFNILGVAFITMALCEIVLEIQKRKKSI